MTQDTIANLRLEIEPVSPRHTLDDVSQLFLGDRYTHLLSLPVVDDAGRPVGTVSRYALMQVYLKHYGREIYGRRPVTELMNTAPLVVAFHEPMDSAAQYVAKHIPHPITEDFIMVDDGRYCGMGIVLDLLRAMEARVSLQTSALHEAYRDLKRSQTHLVQSEKMASLGQMVAGVAHEINTPLGYVKNNLEMTREVIDQARELVRSYQDVVLMLTDENADADALQARLGLAMELGEALNDETFEDVMQLHHDSLFGIDQIAELVLNLKNFSRLDKAKTEDVNLNQCVESALVIGKNVIKDRAQIITRLDDLPPVSCSPSQINQVLLNLVTNAAQAMETPGAILIKSWFDDDFVHVSVHDNGKGMPKDVVDRIFDPFFTTKPVGEGTGLGLAICYQIIEQHGGRIRVASEVGKGTKFVVSLPRSQAALSKAS
ncbi:MAG TPA: CBS domain-containing protein [Thioalkalivibrio sp.]|nr:CBS domain-containing protein [Thioalkalivibrio sp.]